VVMGLVMLTGAHPWRCGPGQGLLGALGWSWAWRKRRWSSFLGSFGIFHSISTSQHRGERRI
jgi:hypothetical protein